MAGCEVNPVYIRWATKAEHRRGCRNIHNVIPLRLSPTHVAYREHGIYFWDVEWSNSRNHDCIPICRACMPMMIVQQLKTRGIPPKKRRPSEIPNS